MPTLYELLELEIPERVQGRSLLPVLTGETSFPLDCITSDPTAAAISENPELAPEEMEATTDAVRSIKVCGVKSDGK